MNEEMDAKRYSRSACYGLSAAVFAARGNLWPRPALQDFGRTSQTAAGSTSAVWRIQPKNPMEKKNSGFQCQLVPALNPMIGGFV